MENCVCSIDLGSSSIKSALVDDKGSILALSSSASPSPEGEECAFDATDYTELALETIARAVDQSRLDASRVSAISVSSQRATTVLTDKDGNALGPALSWQGAHCDSAANDYFQSVGMQSFKELTGLAPSFLYSVSKLAHIAAHEPKRLAAATHVATLHDFFIRQLGTDELLSDPSNASATGLFDISTRTWSPQLLNALKLASSKLPRVVDAGTAAGKLNRKAAGACGLKEGTPLIVGGGNQQCATLGAAGLNRGECVLSLGTSAAAMVPLGSLPANRAHGVFYQCHAGENQWIAEGFMNAYGSAFAQVAELIGCEPSDLEKLAQSSPIGANGVLFAPFPAGIGTPEFNGNVRGAFLNLSLSAKRADLARATLEGLAFECRRLLEAFQQIVPISSIRLVGGGQGDGFVSQLLSDVSGFGIVPAKTAESALLGAAALAWTGVGRFASTTGAASSFKNTTEKTICPSDNRGHYEAPYQQYKEAVSLLISATNRR